MRAVRFLLALLLASAVPAAAAQEAPFIPNFWDPETRMERPDTAVLGPIRFLTASDAPPFSFRARNGALMGFNIDLARAVCAVLEVPCAIQTRPRDSLRRALEDGIGDAIIPASPPEGGEQAGALLATQAYLVIPARFVARRGGAFSPDAPGDGFVGVACNGPHQAYLGMFFGTLKVACYPSLAVALAELKAGRLEAVFGDGVGLAFWLHGAASGDCCAFAGGPYLDERYFGPGLAIQLRPDDGELRAALDYALREIHRSGMYEELYLRYFPVGLF